MRKNEIIQKLESKKFLNYVLDHLQKNDINEKYGIYTGQSLCSLFLNFIGQLDHVIINDYDIFQLIKSSTLEDLEKKEKIERKKNYNLNELSFNNSDRYKELQFKNKSINIYKSIKDNKKNIILCQQESKEGLFLKGKKLIKLIIESFDINSCMIGICLETKEIFYNESFILFILNKKLKIMNYGTPGISYLRLLRKSKELNILLNRKDIYNEKNKINVNNILFLSKNNIDKIEELKNEFNLELLICKNGEKKTLNLNNYNENDLKKILENKMVNNYVKIRLSLHYKQKEIKKYTNLLIEKFNNYKKYYNKLLNIIKKEKESYNAQDVNISIDILKAYFYKKEFTEKEIKNFFKIYFILENYLDFKNEYFNIRNIIFNITQKKQFKCKIVNIKKIILIYQLVTLFEKIEKEEKLNQNEKNYIMKNSLEKIKNRISVIHINSGIRMHNNIIKKVEEYKLRFELENF